MKVLTLSDIVVPFLYSPQIKERFIGIDLAIDCGDLPYYYLEYIGDELKTDICFVRGNHSKIEEFTTVGIHRFPLGATDLHCRVLNCKDLLLAGIEGSLRYRNGPFQYTQGEMWTLVFSMALALFSNHLRYDRYLDVFVTHAPPWGIHDQPDLPHQGIKAFLWLDKVFKPSYHFHGHTHIYRPDTERETKLGNTWVINTYGYRLTDIQPKDRKRTRIDSPPIKGPRKFG
jgi:uncharacterized protein